MTSSNTHLGLEQTIRYTYDHDFILKALLCELNHNGGLSNAYLVSQVTITVTVPDKVISNITALKYYGRVAKTVLRLEKSVLLV